MNLADAPTGIIVVRWSCIVLRIGVLAYSCECSALVSANQSAHLGPSLLCYRDHNRPLYWDLSSVCVILWRHSLLFRASWVLRASPLDRAGARVQFFETREACFYILDFEHCSLN